MTANGSWMTSFAIRTAWAVPQGFTRSGLSGKRAGILFSSWVTKTNWGDEDELEGLPDDGLDTGVLGLDGLFHIGLEGLADDVDDLAEAGFHGVVDGIVDNGLTVGAEAVHLLESAVAAAHAGGEDEKGRFHSVYDF